MDETKLQFMWILVGFVGVLMAAVFAVVIKSVRNKPPESNQEIAQAPEQTPKADSPAPVQPVEEDPFTQSKTLKQALSQTEKNFFGRIRGLWNSETITKNFDEVEEVLYTSDLGPQTVERLMDVVKEKLNRSQLKDIETLKVALKDEFNAIFQSAHVIEPITTDPLGLLKTDGSPAVWMIVGVNGAGKTTSIGKIAAHLAKNGKKVLVAAGDTFRAAAGNQLKVWTERAQVEIFSPEGVTDPSAVAFDAVAKGKAQGYDVILVDTAGRLHTQTNLMEELKKMKRVMTKHGETYPHEVLIVLDANAGQNALMQAKEFHKALGLTGVILTKMDGTAKGGVAVGLSNELQVPIRMIGVGEKIGDLRPFSPKEFVDSIL